MSQKTVVFAKIFSVFVFIFGCSSKERTLEDPLLTLSTDPKPVRAQKQTPEPPPEVDPKSVFFDFNQSILKPSGKAELAKLAQWLKRNPNTKLHIEGYCDERGSESYNLKLAEKRTEASQKFLEGLGIPQNRLSSYAYGELPGSGEQVWAKNRRAAFIIVYPSTATAVAE